MLIFVLVFIIGVCFGFWLKHQLWVPPTVAEPAPPQAPPLMTEEALRAKELRAKAELNKTLKNMGLPVMDDDA